MVNVQEMWQPPEEHTKWPSKWIECLRDPDTSEHIEAKLGLMHGSFKKGRKGERRKENTSIVVIVFLKKITFACVLLDVVLNNHHHNNTVECQSINFLKLVTFNFL